ncbi:MAG: energy transducer TonB [Candidatus Sulfotelmatobacter sp.]
MQKRITVAALVLLSMWMFVPHRALGQTASESTRKVLIRVTPQYPNLARSMNIQGVVKADVLVAPNGTAKSIEIKGGHPLFIQSVQNALHEWKWEPAPHETHEIVELKFSL